jgi:hypothetical protein
MIPVRKTPSKVPAVTDAFERKRPWTRSAEKAARELPEHPECDPGEPSDKELLAFSDATIGALLLRVKKANVLATSTEATEGSQIAAVVPDGQGFNRLMGKHRVVGGKSSEVSRA